MKLGFWAPEVDLARPASEVADGAGEGVSPRCENMRVNRVESPGFFGRSATGAAGATGDNMADSEF